MSAIENSVVGRWRTDQTDKDALREFGDVTLEFDGSSNLKYTVHRVGGADIALLKYRVDGEWLITDQPSSPKEHRARFYFDPKGRLALVVAPPNRAVFYCRVKR